MKTDNLRISSVTIVSLVLMILGITNIVLTALGKPSIKFGTEEVTIFVTSLYTLVVGVWNWWKNNNITKHSLTAQVVLDGLKQGLIDSQELLDAYEDLVKSHNDANSEQNTIEANIRK